MKTLKIKKRRYKRWSDYIVQMSEKEYFEYIRWKEV